MFPSVPEVPEQQNILPPKIIRSKSILISHLIVSGPDFIIQKNVRSDYEAGKIQAKRTGIVVPYKHP